MKALQDFFHDNCIPTFVFFILKHEPCKKIVSLIPFLLTLYVAIILLTFLENVYRRMQQYTLIECYKKTRLHFRKELNFCQIY